MIRITALRKSFGAVTVLDGIDLAVPRGRVTAILGPNGAGKSTLIKLLLGLARPDAGAIRVNDAPVADDPGYRRLVGYMPQAPRLPENLTARELLALVAALRPGESADDERLVARLELGDALDRPLRTLSGGTRQKVSAVLALRFAPTLLVLDEPTAGLDPISAGTFKALVREHRAAGGTVVVTSHVLSELDELADHIVFLGQGRVVFAGPRGELTRRTRERTLEGAVAALMLAARRAAA